jgi:hypothetical protein
MQAASTTAMPPEVVARHEQADQRLIVESGDLHPLGEDL